MPPEDAPIEDTPVKESRSSDDSTLREAIIEAGIGVWVYDLARGTVSIDKRSAKAFGMPSCQSYSDFIERFPPEHRASFLNATERATEPEGAGRFKVTCALPCSKGELKWILATGRCAFEQTEQGKRPVRITGAIQDVTQLKRTEIDLREREAWLDLALEAGGVGTFSYEGRGPARCSLTYRKIFQFGTDEDITESRFLQRVHPDDRDFLRQVIERMEREGNRFFHEYRILRSDGQVRWIEATKRGIKEPERPFRVIGVVRDITDRKEAERALRTAHDRIHLANEAAGIGTWDWELATGIIRVDERVQKVLAIEGHPFIDYAFLRSLMHPDDWEDTDATVQRAASSTEPATYTTEFRIFHPDGSLRWILVKGRTEFEGGKAARFIGVGIDITERKLVEERLARLATIVEASDDFISTADAEGRTIYLNSAARRILGCENAADVRHIMFTDYHPCWDAGRVKEALEQASATGGWLGEATLRAADGSDIPVSQRIVAHRNEAGEVILFSTIARDISERKQYERSLADAARQKDEFLAVLGHELRNPLAALGNAVELLKLQQETTPRLERLVEIMDRQTGYMSRLLDDLLDVSRITRGKIKLENRPLDVRKVVREVTSDVRDRFTREGLSLEVEIPEETLGISGDAVRIAQILSNLLDNARKFTDPPGRVTVRAFRRENSAVLEVEDTGVGFDAESLQNLFLPFQQGPRARSQAPGLGLGLALVKGLVELHEGTVEAFTGPERGARFRVRLPLSASPVVSSSEPAERAPTKERHRLLVVDDNRDSADMLGEALEHLGHEVAIAYDGPEAIEAARRFHPDTVFCDIGLPGAMTGYDVARTLRQELRTARLVAVTGYGRPEDREAARRAGFDRHMTKPVRLAHLEAVLSSP